MDTIAKPEKLDQKDEKTVQNRKPKKKTLMTSVPYPLLKLRDILNTILEEGDMLPVDIRQAIADVRDTALKRFMEDQKKLNSKV